MSSPTINMERPENDTFWFIDLLYFVIADKYRTENQTIKTHNKIQTTRQ